MVDIFGLDTQYTGTTIIKASELIFTIGNMDVTKNFFVQNIVIQASQPIQMVRKIGSPDFMYATSYGQGRCSFGRFVTGETKISTILKDILQVTDQGGVVELKGSTVSYKMYSCLVENIGTNINVDAPYIRQDFSFSFASMEISGANGQAIAGSGQTINTGVI